MTAFCSAMLAQFVGARHRGHGVLCAHGDAGRGLARVDTRFIGSPACSSIQALNAVPTLEPWNTSGMPPIHPPA